ncbi:heavy metal translocating P-type ATPase [Segatella oris]|uniref:P-type Zn(2+) transporter n=1 Tax=Segatella oris TaxID=28135 RepID=A0A448L379_9BACT|nr:heavy metal translocating P-type ATPase [Segatella oris]VEH14444.1 Cadmium, zinc and cobalt-transporting ATPase [Segatella oris]
MAHEAHHHEHEEEGMNWGLIIASAVFLVIGLLLDKLPMFWFINPYLIFFIYIVAFMPVGLPVMHKAWTAIKHEHDFFSEFMLMSVAAVGALYLGEYPEATAVMLLYCIGEGLQDRAVDRARDNIKSLLAFRPDFARMPDGRKERPENVEIGTKIEVRPGERVPLDGRLLESSATFNTAALTGESMPRLIEAGQEVMAGMIATDSVVWLRVVRKANESAISRMLKMVEEATERKAPTENFIHRFAHIYTPAVIALAFLVVIVPWMVSLFTAFNYYFSVWLHLALVFLVISCPCALVISVPLSYFAGIGAASRRGILFKGSNSLDAVTKLDTAVFDKTGTLTTGTFQVEKTVGLSEEDMALVAAVEAVNSHPIAQAIVKSMQGKELIDVDKNQIENVPGYGMKYKTCLMGTLKLLKQEGVNYDEALESVAETIVAVAEDKLFKGYILLADTPKAGIFTLPKRLKAQGIKMMQVLSGDKQALIDRLVVQFEDAKDYVKGYGDLLPEHKVAHIEALKHDGREVAFIGDGINDAPVLALSNVGFAMGKMGADMAVETADVVIQTDDPLKVGEAIAIGRRTRRIVLQNIIFAIGVKVLVMLLGVLGMATLWEAVFADSGVALLAVMNSMRALKK